MIRRQFIAGLIVGGLIEKHIAALGDPWAVAFALLCAVVAGAVEDLWAVYLKRRGR